MPKEKLNYARPSAPQFALHWDTENGGIGQLSVSIPLKDLLSIVEENDDELDTVTLFSDSLSYHEMNGAVRALKRGRDAVHGAAE